MKRGHPGGACTLLVALILILATVLHVQGSRHDTSYTSIIKPLVRSVYWQVSNDQCTAVHVVNASDGGLFWRRSPVSFEHVWSLQVTDKKAFYTLETGPSVTALSLESGVIKWTWPSRTGYLLWRHWDTDLPQAQQLAPPLPSVSTDQVLLRAGGSDSKVVALGLTNGSLMWERDAWGDVAVAASQAGLPCPQQLSIVGWMLDGARTVFISLNAQHPHSNATGPVASSSRAARGRTAGAVHDSGDDPARPLGSAVVKGWVIARDLPTGALLWVAGPLEQGVAATTLSQPTLLVSSAPDAAGNTWLFGVDREGGAVSYSLPCGPAPCLVQVSNARTGLLTAALTMRPAALDSLAAFNLTTGAIVWRGLPDSHLAPNVLTSCTALSTPDLHAYFACTCRSPALGEAEHAAGGVDAVGRSRPKPPRPRPDPTPGPGLCVFAISTDTGLTTFEAMVSSTDAVPGHAFKYGLAPLVLSDVVVFPGIKGVYALQRAPAAPAATRNCGGRLPNELRLPDQAAANPPPDYKPLYSYRFPPGLVMEPWDWLDYKAGSLLIKTSAYEPVAGAAQSAGGNAASVAARGSRNTFSGSASVNGGVADGNKGGGGGDDAFPQTRVTSLDPLNGTLRWSTRMDPSVGPAAAHVLPHASGRGSVLLLDTCSPPADDASNAWVGSGGWRAAARAAASAAAKLRGGHIGDSAGGPGMVCTLYALSADGGKVVWTETFDLDHACASGLRRRTATYIVYGLLAAQVVVLLVGLGLGIYWGQQSRHAPLHLADDQDSEDEGMVVQVLPNRRGHLVALREG